MASVRREFGERSNLLWLDALEEIRIQIQRLRYIWARTFGSLWSPSLEQTRITAGVRRFQWVIRRSAVERRARSQRWRLLRVFALGLTAMGGSFFANLLRLKS